MFLFSHKSDYAFRNFKYAICKIQFHDKSKIFTKIFIWNQNDQNDVFITHSKNKRQNSENEWNSFNSVQSFESNHQKKV